MRSTRAAPWCQPSGDYRNAAFGLAAFVAMPLVLASSRAEAINLEVNGGLDAQFYVVQRPFQDEPIRVRRFTETLGFLVYDLLEREDAESPVLNVTARLRVDSDFGVRAQEVDPEDLSEFVPGLHRTRLDVMYAYVEGRNYLGGVLDFRLGRQQLVDPSGWWSFDGGWVQLATPFYVAAQVYGGLEERGNFPWSVSRYEANGVYRGDRTGMSSTEWPSFLKESKIAPAYGFAVKTLGLSWLTASAGYRKVLDRDTVVTSPFMNSDGSFDTTSGSRVSTEHVTAGFNVTEPDVGAVSADLDYDLYTANIGATDVELDWFAAPGTVLGASYGYYRPDFDGDSIFNWFAHEGMTTWLGHVRWQWQRRVEFDVSGGAKLFRSLTQPENETDDENTETLTDGLVSVATRSWVGATELGAWGMAELGDRGKQAGINFSATHLFQAGRYDLTGLVSFYKWSDAYREENNAASFSYVLVGGFRLMRSTRVGIQWQQAMNHLVGQQFRLLASVRVRVPE